MSIHTHATAESRGLRCAALAVAAALALVVTSIAGSSPAEAVTTGNGALVYAPAAGSSFNPEGGTPAGTTYAKVIVLKHNGSSNGTQLVTFDKLVLQGGVQVYRSTGARTTAPAGRTSPM